MDEVFKENFFVFLNQNQKKKLISELYSNQPFITEMSSKPRFKGFNNLLSLMLKKESLAEEDILNLKRILENLRTSTLEDKFVDWSNIINKEENNLFLIIGLKKEKLNNLGFSKFYDNLHSLSKKYTNVSINYTGGLVIDYEEISSVANGASHAGLLSLFFVTIILWFAFKNIRVIFFLVSQLL